MMAVLPSPDSATDQPSLAEPTAPVPTSFGPCCVNCANASCDEKSSAAEIRTAAPYSLDRYPGGRGCSLMRPGYRAGPARRKARGGPPRAGLPGRGPIPGTRPWGPRVAAAVDRVASSCPPTVGSRSARGEPAALPKDHRHRRWPAASTDRRLDEQRLVLLASGPASKLRARAWLTVG
jgi:hypothetical protein